MFDLPIGHISVLLLIPVLGAALLMLVPRRQTQTLFSLATLASGLDFLWSVKIFALFDGASGEMQLIERAPWMPSFGIQYLVGIDGISLFLVLLTTLLMPVAILASWSVKERVKEYLIFMLLLETGMLGAFVALDLFLFYVFWEVMLVPMYFLIGVWGGTRRIYAALKFVVYTMTGSLLMLVAIIYLATRHAQVEQALTFDVLKLYGLHLPFDQQLWLFLAFALSFAIKVPLFPFHTWLPDAHVEAPTAGSVILAGVLLKLGTYGFLRFAIPLFPDAALAAAPIIVALAVIGITKVRSINHCINSKPSRTSWQRGERVHGETMDPRHPGKHVPCVLAHDVLNKVAGIIGFCELLESDQSESEKELHIRRLRATALLLAELIQERSCDLAVICLSGEAADTGRSTERKPQESISEREHPRTSVSPV